MTARDLGWNMKPRVGPPITRWQRLDAWWQLQWSRLGMVVWWLKGIK